MFLFVEHGRGQSHHYIRTTRSHSRCRRKSSGLNQNGKGSDYRHQYHDYTATAGEVRKTASYPQTDKCDVNGGTSLDGHWRTRTSLLQKPRYHQKKHGSEWQSSTEERGEVQRASTAPGKCHLAAHLLSYRIRY